MAIAATILLGAQVASAQVLTSQQSTDVTETGAPSPWTFLVATYIWLPEIQGTISTRGATADVDIDIDKLFELLGKGDLFAAGGHVEATYDRRFTFFLDAFGGTAKDSTEATLGPRERVNLRAHATLDFTFFEFGAAYRVLDWPRGGPGGPITIDLLTGGRFMYFYDSITLQGSGGRFGRSGNSTSQWIDPFVGGRFEVPLVGDLALNFRGDIGGFGAGSELAWNLIGGFQYRLPWEPWGAQTAIVAVYKALDFDYESGTGIDAVKTKLDLRGPALGLAFKF